MEVWVREVAERFSALPQVEAVAVAGSDGKVRDKYSDYDIYVFTEELVPLEWRDDLADRFSGAYYDLREIDNTAFGPGDEWREGKSGIGADIMYWSPRWMDDEIARCLDRHEARAGYSTCFWYTVRRFAILFDSKGWLTGLQHRASGDYPEPLRRNIVKMNYPLLKKNQSSYYTQIEKALKRDDPVSVNHRIAAFLASYFDILFAVNRQPHPGEKRLLNYCLSLCPYLPENFDHDIRQLLASVFTMDESILENASVLEQGIAGLLKNEGLIE